MPIYSFSFDTMALAHLMQISSAGCRCHLHIHLISIQPMMHTSLSSSSSSSSPTTTTAMPPSLRHQVISIYKGQCPFLFLHCPTNPLYRAAVPGTRVPARVRLLSAASAQGLHGQRGRARRGQDSAGHQACRVREKRCVF